MEKVHITTNALTAEDENALLTVQNELNQVTRQIKAIQKKINVILGYPEQGFFTNDAKQDIDN